jgi:nicotinamide-nucleotide amidase
MVVEVINTGSELLLGRSVNTHLAFLGRELFTLGLRIERQMTVPDGAAIREALAESFARAEIVIVTGGLGPTTDDVTREITAELLGCELVHDDAVMRAIEERFARRGLKWSERVRRQAQVPRGAIVLPNSSGTAPGLYFNLSTFKKVRHLFLLPGPPRELKPMFTDQVAPLLRKIIPSAPPQESRSYRIAGLGESAVEEQVGGELLAIAGLEVGYCARPGEVELRCIGTADAVQQADVIVTRELKDHITSRDNKALEQVIVERLTAARQKLALAESCTGGFIAHRITNVPGASEVLVAGLVTYANEAKSAVLGVPPELIATHGAVSEEVVCAMAEGALRVGGVAHALAVTGIAGPTGGSAEKPAGTVFVALAAERGGGKVERHFFPTDRETFKWLASQAALDLLRRNLP